MSTVTIPRPVLVRVLTVVGAFLFLLLGATAAQANAEHEAEFIRLVNEARVDRGLSALGVAPDLTAVAREHSVVMSSEQRLHHNPNLADDVQNWLRVTENVGVGASVSSLHTAFMNSTGHRANILDSRVTQIGVGVKVVEGRIWVTKVFRLPADPTKTPSLTAPSTTTSTTSSTGTGTMPLWGDWDGDGVATPGRFRDGIFELSNSVEGTSVDTRLSYGRSGDMPVAGDWDGDGTDTIGVYRRDTFILRNEYRSGADDIVLTYGRAGDKPLVGDWDGDGVDTIGVVRGNKFILRNVYKSGADDIVMTYGRTTDTPVVGDWDGNGTTTLGVVRGDRWILRNIYRSGAEDIVMDYGRASDAKVVGDYNNDGRETLGVRRGTTWILRYEYRRGADLIFDY